MLRKIVLITTVIISFSSMIVLEGVHAKGPSLTRLNYENPNLTVDLGAGLWGQPIPMDFDGDGDYDLLVSTDDRPYNGLYFFENKEGNKKHPVFERAVRISKGVDDVTVSYDGSTPYVTSPGKVYPDFKNTGFKKEKKIPFKGTIHTPDGKIQAEEWSYVDFNGNGVLDLIVGIGDYKGNVSNKTGYVYVIENKGTTNKPKYQKPKKVMAGGKPINVYGNPSPVVADFNGDNKPDIITGEFLDKLTYFENVGTKTKPVFREGQFLQVKEGNLIKMDLQMLKVTAIDWTRDGHVDLIVGQEDGRVALIENTGAVKSGQPIFKYPKYFKQKAADVKVGVLATPVSYDWDGDGIEDLLVGDSSGRISFLKNLSWSSDSPKWAAPVHLQAGGKEIRIQPGKKGGPEEEKWGYTTIGVADWNHDGLPDILANSITGEVIWFENIGTRTKPLLAKAKPVEVMWQGATPKPKWVKWTPEENTLVTQWRTNPFVIDLNEDGLNDLVMLDHEGYLAFFERKKEEGKLILLPGKRIFLGVKGSSKFNRHGEATDAVKGPLQLNTETKGGSGRRKFTMTDWDGDGKLDLIVNGKPNVNWLKNVGTKEEPYLFKDMGPIAEGVLAGHSTAPTVVDWNRTGVPHLLIGAEDGHLYYLQNPIQPFSDVDSYIKELKYLKDLGIFTGYANGTFKPEDGITRLDAITVLLRAKNINLANVQAPKLPFADVKPGDRGYAAIAKAYELGYIDGKPHKTTMKSYFDASGNLTRAEMAKIISLAFQYDLVKGNHFKDVRAKDWHHRYIEALYKEGITNGYGDATFRPDETLSRLHFALFMARALNDDFK